MSLFNSLIHGPALTEILLEGHNPYAQRKLETADLDALRQQVFTTEKLRAYAAGRIVNGGRGVWLLTDQAVVLLDARKKAVQRVVLSAVEHFESERGRFGHTIRLSADGQLWRLFGVDRDMAQALHTALQAAGVNSEFDNRATRSHAWRQTAPAGWAMDCIEDARKRLALS